MHKLTQDNIQHVEQNNFIKTIVEWFKTPPLSTKSWNQGI